VLLEETEELRLEVVRQVADLVEEDRPPFAASSRPGLSFQAPVKAPFTWPKSSLSSS
jgi:hypothetical protein